MAFSDSLYHTDINVPAAASGTISLELRLNGVWTEVWTTGNMVSPDTPISAIVSGGPILFAQSTVTGFRFAADQNVSFAFQFFNPDPGTLGGTQTFIEFDRAAVPEPGGALMLLTGALMALCWTRRRLRQIDSDTL